MPNEVPNKRGNGDASHRISFDYIKSSHFRVIRADGAIGSVMPNGHIHFALYSERPAIPRQMVYELDADGKLGKELPDQTVSRSDVVREMEVDVFLTVETAESVRQWLEDNTLPNDPDRAGSLMAISGGWSTATRFTPST